MARPIQVRIIIQGKLITTTPLHVGGYGESFDTDLPLARDGAGGFYVPGTSLAGPMRAWCLDAFDETETDGETETEKLWGFQEKPRKDEAEETTEDQKKRRGHASFAMVEDAQIQNVCGEYLRDYETEIRDGVGINRKWGVAENRIKFDRAILPRGSKLDFRMSVDVEDDDKDDDKAREKLKSAQAKLGHLLQSLCDGEVPFGASKTRGLGRVRLVAHEVRLQKRKGKDFLKHLRTGGDVLTIAQLKAADASLKLKRPARLDITIGWEPRGALMIKSGADGIGVDMLPLVSGKDGSVAPILSGSSVKGALRSHGERIVRTLTTKCLNGEEEFDEQLSPIPLIVEMFGMGKPAKNKNKQEESSVTKKREDGRIGALAVMDCYAEKALLREQWLTVMTAKEKTLQGELDKIKNAGNGLFEQMPHVAIDRWTGGAADSMLFSTLEPYGVSWEPIVLTLDLEPRRHAHDKKDWANRNAAVALLFLLLRDLAAGRVPLGFAVNRGMGEIKINSIEFKGKGLLEEHLSALTDLPVALNDGDSFFNKLSASALLAKLNEDWQSLLSSVKGDASQDN